MLDGLLCILIKFVNLLFDILFGWWIDMLIFLISLLPTTPFLFEDPVEWGPFGNAIGYFIPIETMVIHFAAVLVSVAIWYGVQHALRLIRMVK